MFRERWNIARKSRKWRGGEERRNEKLITSSIKMAMIHHDVCSRQLSGETKFNYLAGIICIYSHLPASSLTQWRNTVFKRSITKKKSMYLFCCSIFKWNFTGIELFKWFKIHSNIVLPAKPRHSWKSLYYRFSY